MHSTLPDPDDGPQLILCAGGAGGGKSTLLRHLAVHGFGPEATQCIAYDDFRHAPHARIVDHIHWEKVGANEAWFLNERQRHFSEALEKGGHVIVETHLDHAQQIADFAEQARAKGYKVHIAGMVLMPETFRALRHHYNGLDASTPLGLLSQTRFLHALERLPFTPDTLSLHERRFNAHENGLHDCDEHRLNEIRHAWGTDIELLENRYAESPVPQVQGEKSVSMLLAEAQQRARA